jgi:hypothetical protein
MCMCVCVCVCVNNLQLFNVAMVTQHCASVACLSGFKIFHAAVNAIRVYLSGSSCTRRYPDVPDWW